VDYFWIDRIEDFCDIAPDWDKGVRDSKADNPFLLSDFITTWWKHHREGLRLAIFVVRDGHHILGGLPLYLKRGGWREGFANIFSHIGDSAANYTEPLYTEAARGLYPMLVEALRKRASWDALLLTDIRTGSRFLEEVRLHKPKQNGFVMLTQDHMNWAIDLSRGLEDYRSSLSKGMRRNLGSRRRYAQRHYGDLKLCRVNGREEVEKYFDLYAEFSQSSFEAKGKKSNVSNKSHRLFFREFLVKMDQKGCLDGYVLWGGQTVLAIIFGYRFGGGFNWVITAYDHRHRYVRPGYLLFEELMKEGMSRGESYHNIYGHARFYKTQLCNEKTPLYQLVILNRTSGGMRYKRVKELIRYVKRNN